MNTPMQEALTEEALRQWLIEQAEKFEAAPWRNDPYIAAHAKQLREWAALAAARSALSAEPQGGMSEVRCLPPLDGLASAWEWYVKDHDNAGHRRDCPDEHGCHCGFENLRRVIDGLTRAALPPPAPATGAAKFKVGDRVRIARAVGRHAAFAADALGQVGVITQEEQGDFRVLGWWLTPDCFEPVQAPELSDEEIDELAVKVGLFEPSRVNRERMVLGRDLPSGFRKFARAILAAAGGRK